MVQKDRCSSSSFLFQPSMDKLSSSSAMSKKTVRLRLFLPCILFFLFISPPTLADVGTASSYGPPYLPTECYGSDEGQFPANNLFAAAGDAIWDNGASCGRQYLVRCLSSAAQGACVDGATVQVTVVDYAASLVSAPSAAGATMVLSATAFGTIAQSRVNLINIEFTQV